MFDEKHDEASVCFLREFDKSLLRWKQRRDACGRKIRPREYAALLRTIFLKRISISLHPFFRFPF